MGRQALDEGDMSQTNDDSAFCPGGFGPSLTCEFKHKSGFLTDVKTGIIKTGGNGTHMSDFSIIPRS